MSDSERLYGIVREFHPSTHTGTIEAEDGGYAVFVRYSVIMGDGVRTLHPGQRVSFELESDTEPLSAIHVVGE